jgi:sulfur transfer complex TusBCD TusB component (DsrH family)
VNRILHILKEINQPEALAIIAKQAGQPSQELAVLLIQEAVRLPPDLPVKVYVLEEDARTRDVTSKFETISYSKMLDLIFSSNSVVVW